MATATTAPAATGAKQPQSFAELPVAAKLFVLVFILAFLSGGYYFALHMDLADQIDGAVAAHAQLEQDLVAAQARQQEYLRLSQELADREPIDRLNKRILPERAEMAAFLQDINSMGELSGLQIALVEPQPEEQQALYVKVPVQLELRGHFHQFAKFFFNISQRERAINMENVELSIGTGQSNVAVARGGAQEGGLEEVNLSVKVLATTFHRPAAPPAAAAAPAAGGH